VIHGWSVVVVRSSVVLILTRRLFKSQNEVEEWEVISKEEGFPSLSDARPPFKFSSTLFIMARIEQDVFLFLM